MVKPDYSSELKIFDEAGFTLPYILIISILLITTLSGLITIIFFYHFQDLKQISKKELELACYSAVQIHLTNLDPYKEGEQTVVIDSIQVRLNFVPNGFFYDVNAKAISEKCSVEVNYTIGSSIDIPFDNALIISRPSLRASVAGVNKVIGDILATSTNFKRGSVFGYRNSQEPIVQGKIKTLQEIKPKVFNDSLMKILKERRYSDTITSFDEDLIIEPHSTILKGLQITCLCKKDIIFKGDFSAVKSLKSITLLVRGKTIFDKNTYWNLNSKIISDSTITLMENARCENIVIYSKNNVEVEKSICKNIQMISDKDIIIKNSIMKYPSLLSCNVNTHGEQNLKNTLSLESTEVNGWVLMSVSTIVLMNNKSKIRIDNSSMVNGLVYSENNSEIIGEIVGTVYTYNLWFYKEPTEYINWLVNLKINRRELNEFFLLPLGFNTNYEILHETWTY